MSQVVEKHRQILINKLNEKNLVLDEEDKCTLELFPEYEQSIVKILATGLEYWNDEIYHLLGDNTLFSMDPQLYDAFWLNYAKYLYENQIELDEDIIQNVLNMFKLKEETKEQIMTLLTKQKSELSETKSTNVTIEELTKMYENKRFDLIANIDYEIYGIPDKLIADIMTEFPYEQYESPTLFARYQRAFHQTINDISKLSIKTLAKMLETTSYYEYSNPYTIPQIAIYLNMKCQKQKFATPTFLPIDVEKIESYLSTNKYELAKLTFENNNLSFLPFALECNTGTKEQQIQFIIEYINQKKGLDTLLKKRVESLDIKDNKQLIDCLIENGCIYLLLEKNAIEPNSEEEKTIINHIRENHPNYKNIASPLYLTKHITEYPNILQAIIDNSEIRSIKLEAFLGIYFEQYEYTEEMHNALIKMIKKEQNFHITNHHKIKQENQKNEIINLLVALKMYDEIVEMFNDIHKREIEQYLKENTEEFKKLFEESLYFPKKLMNMAYERVLETPLLRKIYCENEYSAQILIDYINHHEEYTKLYTHELFLYLLDTFASKYNVSKERLSRFEEKFGPKIIRYIENENVQEILKLEEENFNKIMQLFPECEFTMQDLEAAYDSLKQYEFSKKYPNELSIFPDILHAIEDKDEEKKNALIEKLPDYLDRTFFKRFTEKYNLPAKYDQNNPKMFVAFVIAKIELGDPSKREKYIEILHNITDYYILKKREEYRATYDMRTELDLPYTLDAKSYDTEYYKYLIRTCGSHHIRYTIDKDGNKTYEEITLKEYLRRKLTSYGIEETLIEECLQYYGNYIYQEDTEKETKVDTKTIQKQFKYLMKAIQEIAKEQPQHDIFYDSYKQFFDCSSVKRIYTPGPNGIDIYEVLTTLRMDVLKECVLPNKEVYTSLQKTMQKKKLHILPLQLKNVLTKPNMHLSGDFSNISSFISYYAQIYEKEKSKLEANNKSTEEIALSLVNILINAEVYGSVSSIYSQILGEEDSKLIKANPSPNSASLKLANDGRLKEAVELTMKNFQRQTVTIPAFNEEVELSNTKRMRIIAGNFTHPSNLTHGERTGACMRIGGMGESLFYFCLKNPNGFHIRFEDPETGKYISRVSGFRNGNTIFLNELRYSCDQQKYRNEDVVEACQKAAQRLIEYSKNSSYPIKNVVIHRAYAIENSPEENVILDKANIKEGLAPFYTDVSNSVIVLATTAQEQKFVPLNFEKGKIPDYLPAREKPYETSDIQKGTPKITRVDTIKRILNGENYNYISPVEFPDGFIYGIMSDDWYIYVDEEQKIHSDVINIDPRAKEELVEYTLEIEKKLQEGTIKKENAYGIS